ncbi:hypothetical protein [Variovorax soli]|uniref:hypothetical protein n=1 Tax=Variovorax soli TaxID=376815 RepID=UPI0008382A99|nr:hypothetical protein [Variovorax soli]
MYVTKLVEFDNETALLLPDELIQKSGWRLGDTLKLEDRGVEGFVLKRDESPSALEAGSAQGSA